MFAPSGQLNLRRLLISAVVVCLVVLGSSRLGRRLAGACLRPFVGAERTVGVFCRELWYRLFPNQEKARQLLEAETRWRDSQVRLARVEELLEENRQLRNMLEVSSPPGWRSLAAEVISRDPAIWNWEWLVASGTDQGVQLGAAVLVGASVAGRVTEVFQTTARISTLLSPDCRIGGLVVGQDGTSYPGVCRGVSPPLGDVYLVEVDFLPKTALIQAGDAVITSGLGKAVPAGLPIGVLAADQNGRCPLLVDDARAKSLLQPYAAFHSVRFVTILIQGEQKP
ncbi:MAG: rod shape-determining protein MreC [Victivallales bacterium]|nr:rod shape-determining protein MreC [Victivallales bacterium]